MSIQEIRKLIARIGAGGYRDGSSTRAGVPYQPIPFSQFQDGPAQKRGQILREWEILRDHLAHTKARPDFALDIGANVGHHAFSLAQFFGCCVMAVESDSANRAVLDALADWSGLNVWSTQSLDEALSGTGTWDVALMLNVHHWIHKQRGPAATLDLMRRLANRTRLLFFQTAHRGSGSFYCVEELEDAKGVGDYLIQAGFTDPRVVAVTEHGGKPRYLFTAQGSSMSRPAGQYEPS